MVKSYRGKNVDMQKLLIINEKAISVGNTKMNARGDILGKGGVIVKTVEERTKEYYEANPTAETEVSLKSTESAPQVVVDHNKSKPKPKAKVVTKEVETEIVDGE